MSATVKKIFDSGNPDKNTLNFVIMGDGYQASEEAAFDWDCQTKVAAILADPVIGSKQNIYKLNFYSLFVASAQSGISMPGNLCSQQYPGYYPPATTVSTYFGSSFNFQGMCRAISPRAGVSGGSEYQPLYDLIKANFSDYNYQANWLPCLQCNTPYDGGLCGGATPTWTISPNSNAIAVHEIGHAMGLSDEYPTGANMEGRNVTAILPLRWLLTYNGFVYKAPPSTVYMIPTAQCIMNQMVNQKWCVVCAVQVNEGINAYITTYSGGTLPTSGNMVAPLPPSGTRPTSSPPPPPPPITLPHLVSVASNTINNAVVITWQNKAGTTKSTIVYRHTSGFNFSTLTHSTGTTVTANLPVGATWDVAVINFDANGNDLGFSNFVLGVQSQTGKTYN